MATPTLDKVSSPGQDAGHLVTVTFRIRRFNPEVSAEASWQDFEIRIDPKERVLDALHQIKWEDDGTLTFRARAPTASAARTRCASTAATGWPARP